MNKSPIIKTIKKYPFLILSFVLLTSFVIYQQQKPVLYIIGDSTVKNGNGNPGNIQQGWGSWIDANFDTNQISIQNHAIGGRSSRTFLTEGRWDKIIATLKKGDYVMMQFGHNDSSPLDDTARARGTIKGIGDDSIEIYNPIRKVREMVHTYGWYMRKYINETKAKGAIPIICSPIPRYSYKDGKINRDGYTVWSKELAEQTGSYFIPLNELIAMEYEKTDSVSVKKFFPQDNTHTNKAGALMNAQLVVKGLKETNCTLKNYLLH
jgi:lysophospholipase L1-like esterase